MMTMMKFNSVFGVFSSMIMLSVSMSLITMGVFVWPCYESCLEVTLMSISIYKISLLFIFDYMSLSFFGTVGMVSGAIFLFSSSYMSSDLFSNRFLGLVTSFIISMGFLIFSPNLLSLLLGWDGLGVTSYLLVCYYSSEKSFNASMLTALSNRVGDVLILLFISTNLYPGIANYGLASAADINYSLTILIVMAAMTKSAQVPFSAWLPAAMAAPTPVSALVHSSTLVTAGVYLLIRFNSTLMNSGVSWLVITAGCITMIMAGAAALLELDMKKIVALSTLSQLGLMMFTLGIGEIFLSWTHLISHAYFKAMMFMSAGAMIHSVGGYQDIRKMGSLSSNNYFISGVFLSGSLSLCGMPFFSGFYSKDAILEQFIMSPMNTWTSLMVFTATVFTAMYSTRVLMMLFISFSSRESFSAEGDSNSRMSWGMLSLFPTAVLGGLFLTSWSHTGVFVALPLWLKLITLSGVMIFAAFNILLNVNFLPMSFFLSGAHQMWYLPKLVSPTMSQPFFTKAKILLKYQEYSWALWLAGGWGIVLTPLFSSLMTVKVMSALMIMIYFALMM